MGRLTSEEARTIGETALFVVLLLLCLLYLQGCVPMITGIKTIDTSGDGTRIDFITGLDVGAQANGIDRVEDLRGIAPRGERAKN